MCTAVSFVTKDHYFGRNLDVYHNYGEQVVITPENFPLCFKYANSQNTHYAIIGTAVVAQGYPLYFDGANGHGLCMAGLNFPDNAVYLPYKENMKNIAPFELIPFVLGQCKTAGQAKELLRSINIVNAAFSDELPLTPLHWIISDKTQSITVEPTNDGVKIYDNPVGVLTNNPPFYMQMFNLNNYMRLSNTNPKNTFSDRLNLNCYSLGMGGIGLPGDLSSMSRFVRGVFTKYNCVCDGSEQQSVSQFFHILNSVYQPYGLNDVGDGVYEYTTYSCCFNADKGIYYYTTYQNSSITAVDMNKVNLYGNELYLYPHIKELEVVMQN